MRLYTLLLLLGLAGCQSFLPQQTYKPLIDYSHHKSSDTILPIKMGNGQLGAHLQITNDSIRIDLNSTAWWDMRPNELEKYNQFSYQWIYSHLNRNQYDKAIRFYEEQKQQVLTPCKLPGISLILPFTSTVSYRSLNTKYGEALLRWTNGNELLSFIDQENNTGWILLQGDWDISKIKFQNHAYTCTEPELHECSILKHLNYPIPSVVRSDSSLRYLQPLPNGDLCECRLIWSQATPQQTKITWSMSKWNGKSPLLAHLNKQINRPISEVMKINHQMWSDYHTQSSINLPDKQLNTYYNYFNYLFGAATTLGDRMLSTPVLWNQTEHFDNQIKGLNHNYLFTQMCYWHAYTANHLKQSGKLPQHILASTSNFQKYSKSYFNKPGLFIPGLTSTDGSPSIGDPSYTYSPTVACWLAHHFFLQWSYERDDQFLREKAYPFMRECIEGVLGITKRFMGQYRLHASSSPEYKSGSYKAWFNGWTNYDLAIVRRLLTDCHEVAVHLNDTIDQRQWSLWLERLPNFNKTRKGGLSIANNHLYGHSAPYLSHLVGIYPLGLLSPLNGEKEKEIIDKSLANVEKYGNSNWQPFTYVWLANLYAYNRDTEKTIQYLKSFLTHYKSYADRATPVENGAFAFCSAIQQLLLKQHNEITYLLPDIPDSWKDCEFNNLVTSSGLHISLKKENGVITSIAISSNRDQEVKLKTPTQAPYQTIEGTSIPRIDGNISFKIYKGATVKLKVVYV